MTGPMRFDTPDGTGLEVGLTRCLIAGWTGRDAAKVAAHIEELAELGVPRPSATPLYYRVPSTLVTQADRVQVVGEATGGEVEPVVIDDGRTLWLTLGSDHTDRALESTSVAHAKAVCAKPVAASAWPWHVVSDRLDSLTLRAEVSSDGWTWTPYQEGALAAILPLGQLVAGAPDTRSGRLGEGSILFCGTLPAIGGVRPTPWFRATLDDSDTGRRLQLSYVTESLPVIA